MKIYFTILIIALSYTSQVFSQSGKSYDDLLEMYVDEKYEKLAYKSEGYFLNDKYKKDPMPYLYFSMANFAFTKDERLAEKYPKAFKDALKFAGKFVKKDKENEYLDEAEDFFEELRAAAMEDAENQIINEKYTKAKGMYKYLVTMDNNDPGAKMYMAYSAFKMRSAREAQLLLEEGINILQSSEPDNLTDQQKMLLKNAIITLSEWQDNGEYRAQITTAFEKTKDLFSEAKDFNRAYDSFM